MGHSQSTPETATRPVYLESVNAGEREDAEIRETMSMMSENFSNMISLTFSKDNSGCFMRIECSWGSGQGHTGGRMTSEEKK